MFEIDLTRVKSVMPAIAHAIYYKERGHTWAGSFEIFCALRSERSLQGLADGSERIGTWLSRRKYENRPTLYPDVLEYQVHDSDELIFAMQFYGGPWIYARRVGRIVAAPGPALLTAV